jgi:purine-binding chemotaxis protein CheW
MFGIDIRFVKEVYPKVDLCLVPRSEEYVRGLVNIRGQVVLVMDISVFFEKEVRPVSDSSQIIIMKIADEMKAIPNLDLDFNVDCFGDKPVGFIADRIGDVISIEAGELEAPPSHLSGTKARYFKGVVKFEEGVLLVLNPEKFIEDSIEE